MPRRKTLTLSGPDAGEVLQTTIRPSSRPRNIEGVIETRHGGLETHVVLCVCVVRGSEKKKKGFFQLTPPPKSSFCISASLSTCIFNSAGMSVSVGIKGRAERGRRGKRR